MIRRNPGPDDAVARAYDWTKATRSSLEHFINGLALDVATLLAGLDQQVHDGLLAELADEIIAETLRRGGTAELAEKMAQAVCTRVGAIEADMKRAGGGHDVGRA
jgi:hypothetical protein